MNEMVRNNVVFASAKAFRQALVHFFANTIPTIKNTLLSRITDNFQTFNTVFSEVEWVYIRYDNQTRLHSANGDLSPINFELSLLKVSGLT